MSKDAKKNAWLKYDENGKQEVFNFCEGYKNYLSVGKTERECIHEAIRLAEEKGYRNLNEIIKNNETLKVGDKVYSNNKEINKIHLITIGCILFYLDIIKLKCINKINIFNFSNSCYRT